MDTLLEPYDYAFFQRGLIAAVLAGALCGLIGVFIVQRGMSYIGHGLSHSIFGGFAASSVAGISYYLGAGLWGFASAIAVNALTRSKRIGADAAIGVITTASFALGIAMIAHYGNKGPAFDAALFGSILGVRPLDLWVLTGVSLTVLAVVLARYRELVFVSFDPDVATAHGVKVARVDALLMALLSAAILTCLHVIGVTLVAAALVIPAVAARLLTDSFARMLWLATILGGLCGFVGMNAGYHLDIPSGTAIVLTGAAVFLVALSLSGLRGRVPGTSDVVQDPRVGIGS
jgi:manganese/iron transport system permease protein/iron/zinc/copper transport system permease protein